MRPDEAEGRPTTKGGPSTAVSPARLDEGIVSHAGGCGCCAVGDRRAALDRLQAQEDARRIATWLTRLGADLVSYYGPRRAA